MSAEIINAFGRKSADPLSPPETPLVCEHSVTLARELVRMTEAGEMTNLAFAGVFDKTPMSGCVRSENVKIASLAMLSIAADAMKDQVRDLIRSISRQVDIGEDGEEIDSDE